MTIMSRANDTPNHESSENHPKVLIWFDRVYEHTLHRWFATTLHPKYSARRAFVKTSSAGRGVPNYVRTIVDNIDRNKSFNRDIVRHPSFFFFLNCRHETHSQVADAICRKLEWIQWWHKTDTTIRVSLSIVYITGPLIYDYYLQRFHL